MPDIREVLNALSIDDRALYQECRSNMRRAFFHAHNETVGIASWASQDDSLLDLIDIRLALLFDRAGRLNAVTDIIGVKDGDKIHNSLESEATKKLNELWKNGK